MITRILSKEITFEGRTSNNMIYIVKYDLENGFTTIRAGMREITLPYQDFVDIIDAIERAVVDFCEKYQPTLGGVKDDSE